MKLYILGKNREGKGTALEELTDAILSQFGYKVVRNQIGYGGHEIDVVAKFEQQVIGETKEIPVICECKAHSNPIAIGDWLKFLGKVLIERMNNAQTMGVMIALSGVNGNVQGNYDELPDKSYLSLICNDRLLDAVCRHYKLKPAEEIRSFVEHKTLRVIDSIDLVYFEKEIWWLVEFVHGEFTILSNNLSMVGDKYLDEFLDNLQDVSSYAKSGYRDIMREEISRIRTDIIARTIVVLLMKNGEIPVDELLERTKQMTNQIDIDRNELIKALEEYPYFDLSSDGKAKLYVFDTDGMINFYLWYLRGQIVVDSIIYDFYRNPINDDLLDKIIHLQNDIVLTKEQRENALFMLRLSPNALLYALNPDDLIVRSRTEQTSKIDIINKFHTDRFLNRLTDCLVADLENGQYCKFYYQDYGISEFHVDKKLTLNFINPEREKIIDYSNNVALMECNGDVVSMLMFDKNVEQIMEERNDNN
jgi:Holliday junction resolvase-like predicted endonuclease